MRAVAVAIGAFLVVVAVLVVPAPWFAIAPGEAIAVPPRVELDVPADPVSGSLLLTTVRLRQPSLLGAVVDWIDDDVDLVDRDLIIPPGAEREEVTRVQRRLFQESAEIAAAVGVRAAGENVVVSGEGARVVDVVPDSPAAGVLSVGDVIVAVDGEPVQLAADLVAAIAQRTAGDTVELRVRREEATTTTRVDLTLEAIGELGRPGLGVAIETIGRRIELPIDVDVDQGRIGGPSAGLMLALTVYDLVDPGDLTDGRTVAGTGTIDLNGRVGVVGGVEQKVETAEDAGASVFLVPPAEAEAARAAADDDLRIVPVATFEEALAALE